MSQNTDVADESDRTTQPDEPPRAMQGRVVSRHFSAWFRDSERELRRVRGGDHHRCIAAEFQSLEIPVIFLRARQAQRHRAGGRADRRR
jgi:hypothetical protein